jgi:phosphoglycolate phosphatase-like HAD superfamily hydrolase
MMQLTERLANAYKPMRGIEFVVNKLHNHGFTQRIASNIGPRFYTIIKDKFARRGSSIFSHVSLGKVVDYSRFGDHTTKPYLDPEFLVQKGKPHPAFYHEFSSSFNPNNQIIILIDDRVKNVKAAARAGWIGVHYSGKRRQAIVQLQKDLRFIGLL